jgi:hypothetical protein
LRISKTENLKPKTEHTIERLKKAVFLFMFLMCGVFGLQSSSFAQASASSELIGWAKHYDGKTVTFEGEIIGDIMVRGSKAWINVNDGSNAIGVLVDSRLLSSRLRAGSYTSKGSWVSVSGFFSRACSEHGGDLDIHAQSVTVIHDGYAVPEKVDLQKSGFALIAMLAAGAVWLLFLWKPKKA